jgi:hypothetical protein
MGYEKWDQRDEDGGRERGGEIASARGAVFGEDQPGPKKRDESRVGGESSKRTEQRHTWSPPASSSETVTKMRSSLSERFSVSTSAPFFGRSPPLKAWSKEPLVPDTDVSPLRVVAVRNSASEARLTIFVIVSADKHSKNKERMADERKETTPIWHKVVCQLNYCANEGDLRIRKNTGPLNVFD